MKRTASAVWKGNLHQGEGTLTTESGVLSETQYSYGTYFPEGIGTNPDELIAASLGGCFSMALSSELGLCGFHPERIETIATATLEDLAAGWTVTHMQIDIRANVPDTSQARFMDAALAAKTKCPIARSAQHKHLHDCESQPMASNGFVSQAKPMPASGRGNSLQLAPEVSELRYRRLFETAQDGILILDADSGKIIDVNPFLLDLLDYPFESIIGLQLWEIGLFEDIAANQAAFAKLQKEEYIRYENRPLRTKAGKQIQVEFVSNVYFVGSAKVIQCNIRDISVRVRAAVSGGVQEPRRYPRARGPSKK